MDGATGEGGAGRRSRRSRARLGLVLVGLLLVSLPATAWSAVTRAQVLRALHVDRVQADYVVVVDTSGSMEQGGLYEHVRAALRPLLAAVSARDHLSLITFDTTPALRYSGFVGHPSGRALGRLPQKATGQHTDIGAAISGILGELERPSAADVATVVVLTDGKHDPGAGSAYPSTSGPSWNALGRRGATLQHARTLSAFALALRPATDASLLKRAFSNAQVVDLPRDQLASFLGRIKEETEIAKAKRVVSSDLAGRVTVSWPAASLSHLDLTKGSATIPVTVRSHERYVPLVLSGFAASSAGLALDASGLPPNLALAPQQSRTFPVNLSFKKASGFHLGHKTVLQSGALALHASIGTPWQQVLNHDLGSRLRTRLTGASTPVRARGTIGWSLLGILLLVVVIGLALAAAAGAWINRRPKLRGSLTVSGSGEPMRKAILHGRVMKIGRGQEIDLPATGRVEGKRVKKRGRRRGTDVELLVRYGKGAGARIPSGHARAIGDINFAYRDL